MNYDRDKVDEMVLALLWLTPAGDGRAWKGHDWDALDRLHAKGYISDPRKSLQSSLRLPQWRQRIGLRWLGLRCNSYSGIIPADR
jgi:hypothetical protein